MAASLKLFPGSTVRWCGRRYMILDYAGLDAIIGREPGKRRPERIPVSEAKPDRHQADSAWIPPDFVSVPEGEWQAAVERFEILKPLITMDRAKRTLTDIKRAARVLGRHPVTVYRWIENYKRCERLSVFLRKRRSDRGTSRQANADSQRSLCLRGTGSRAQRIRLAGGKLRQGNADLWVARNARIVNVFIGRFWNETCWPQARARHEVPRTSLRCHLHIALPCLHLLLRKQPAFANNVAFDRRLPPETLAILFDYFAEMS